MEELVEYLEGVKCLKTKNPPERNNWNNNKSSGLKKTKKGKHKCDKDKKSQDVLDNNASSKKSHKHYKLYKMSGGNAESHNTDHSNKNNLLSSLLDGHKKKHFNRSKKEDFCTMAKAHKRSYHDSSESDSSFEEEEFTLKLDSLGDSSLTKLAYNINQVAKKSRLVKLMPELGATIISKKSNGFIAKRKNLRLEQEGEIL
eukprot:15346816-Ditylum_brightwellii.AAC.1